MKILGIEWKFHAWVNEWSVVYYVRQEFKKYSSLFFTETLDKQWAQRNTSIYVLAAGGEAVSCCNI